MVHGEGTILIRRSPRDILEFVLDLEKYRRAYRKFRRILYVTREGNRGVARYSARLRGIPTPADTQEWRLDPYTRLEFKSTPKIWPNAIATFEGWFICEQRPEGTEVTHVEQLFLRPPFRWLADPYLRTWWQQEVHDEVIRLRDLIEASETVPDA